MVNVKCEKCDIIGVFTMDGKNYCKTHAQIGSYRCLKKCYSASEDLDCPNLPLYGSKELKYGERCEIHRLSSDCKYQCDICVKCHKKRTTFFTNFNECWYCSKRSIKNIKSKYCHKISYRSQFRKYPDLCKNNLCAKEYCTTTKRYWHKGKMYCRDHSVMGAYHGKKACSYKSFGIKCSEIALYSDQYTMFGKYCAEHAYFDNVVRCQLGVCSQCNTEKLGFYKSTDICFACYTKS